jgi:predicted amidohydrolase
MNKIYDLLLKNGTLVDPVNQRCGRLDVAVQDRLVAEIAVDIDPGAARHCVDVQGFHLLPGLIDLHVHLSSWLGGRWGHHMLALAGVTTALDMAGPIDGVLPAAQNHGCGLSIATIEYIRPGENVTGPDPGAAELEQLLEQSLRRGSIGLKVLGGHYPLTPEAMDRAITATDKQRVYLALHAGSLANPSNLEGFKEAVGLSAGRAVHVAHINSYCRGAVRPYMEETETALRVLEDNPHLISESYLATINGTSAELEGERPASQVTAICLEKGGFPANRKGMEAAIRGGWAQIHMERIEGKGGRFILASGQEALAYWRSRQTLTGVSFAVNPPEPRLRLAAAKRSGGGFTVDALSTDGGGIPRNVLIDQGLSLVRLNALSLEEFVLKTSFNPAQILGLTDKGHLRSGMEADITVVDLQKQLPEMTLSRGEIIMQEGKIRGKGCTCITTPKGQEAISAYHLTPLVIDPSQHPFCTLSRQ